MPNTQQVPSKHLLTASRWQKADLENAVPYITTNDETKFGFVDLLSICQRQDNYLFENISFIWVIIVLSTMTKLHDDIGNV